MKSEKTTLAAASKSPIRFPIVAMGASRGGLRALGEILSALPKDFPGAILVVQHISPHRRSYLDEILGRRTSLQVKQARAGDRLRPGKVFIAPPDRHLLVSPLGTVRLSRSAKVRYSRPAVDVLFESVAANCGKWGIGVVLTGADFNGSTGVRSIRAAGGTVVAQDKATSEVFSMPRAAIATGMVDYVLPLDEIANFLAFATEKATAQTKKEPADRNRKLPAAWNGRGEEVGCLAETALNQ